MSNIRFLIPLALCWIVSACDSGSSTTTTNSTPASYQKKIIIYNDKDSGYFHFIYYNRLNPTKIDTLDTGSIKPHQKSDTLLFDSNMNQDFLYTETNYYTGWPHGPFVNDPELCSYDYSETIVLSYPHPLLLATDPNVSIIYNRNNQCQLYVCDLDTSCTDIVAKVNALQ